MRVETNLSFFMRLHLFEFEDLPWFPETIRSGGTDYLRYFLILTELYQPTIALINESLETTNENNIIDLCSGGGGYIEQICEGLGRIRNKNFKITLTDKYPNLTAFRYLKEKTEGKIDYYSDSVDVSNVPSELKGFRTSFSAIHHFRPQQVKEILQNAILAGSPIGIFDGGTNRILAILGMIIIHPIALILFTPFFKPFRLSRIFFTYLLPLIPICTVWDGVVSILRMYHPKELRNIADSIQNSNYVWRQGKTKNRFGIKATYLIGYPHIIVSSA